MDSELESTAAAAVAIAIIVKRRKIETCKKERSMWVKDWLKRRQDLGVSATLLLREFREEDHFDHFEYGKFCESALMFLMSL